MSVRAFPAPKHTRPAGWPGPWCRWCGEGILHGRHDRSRHDGRKGEPNCAREYALHTDRDLQYRHVAARDGERCWGCKETPLKVVRGGESFIYGGFVRDGAEWVDGTRFCRVEIKPALEIEHTVPLWSVAHLPDDERRKFFGPEYLRLLGPCCHKPKTKAEAGQRAKVKRLVDQREQPRKPSTMRSRPFPKGGPKRVIQSRGFR